jgi:hypothetical protein
MLSTLLLLAPSAQAQDTVHACIDASTKGQTLRKSGKLLDARQQMIACARDACPAIVRTHCAGWLGEVEALIPTVVVRAQDATGSDLIDARVAIDGKHGKLDGQPVPLDPGEHEISVQTADGATLDTKVLLVAGEKSRLVTLRLPARPAAVTAAPTAAVAGPSTHHVPVGAWFLGGAGVVSLGVGTAFVLAASNQLSMLRSTCSPNCSSAQTQPGRTDSLLGDILLGAGAAGLGAAIVWALAFPSSSSEAAGAAQLQLSPLLGGAMTSVTVRY